MKIYYFFFYCSKQKQLWAAEIVHHLLEGGLDRVLANEGIEIETEVKEIALGQETDTEEKETVMIEENQIEVGTNQKTKRGKERGG